MKKIILISIVVLLTICLSIYVYISGTFHAKKFTINNIVIHAPEDRFLFMVTINDEIVYDALAPLKFSGTTQYTFIKNGENAYIVFSHSNSNNYISLTLSIYLDNNKKYFKGFLQSLKKDFTLKAINNKYCKLYDYYDKDNNIHNMLVYQEQKTLFTLISSDKRTTLLKTMHAFCSNSTTMH